MNNERIKNIQNMAAEVKRKLLTIEPKVIFLVADDLNMCEEVMSVIRNKNPKIKKVKSSYQNSETPYNHHAYTVSSKSGKKLSNYVVLRNVRNNYSSGSLSIAVESLLRKCIDVVIITSERPYLMGDISQSLVKNKTPIFEFICDATDNTFISSIKEESIDILFDGEPLKECVNYSDKPNIADFDAAIPFPDVETKHLEEKNQQLRNVIDKADKENQQLRNVIDKADKENQQLRNVIDKADKEISEVCIRATESERHVEHLNSHIKQLLCEIDVLTSFIKDFDDEMEVLKTENEILKEKGQKIFEEKKIELFSQVKRSLTSLFRDAR